MMKKRNSKNGKNLNYSIDENISRITTIVEIIK